VKKLRVLFRPISGIEIELFNVSFAVKQNFAQTTGTFSFWTFYAVRFVKYWLATLLVCDWQAAVFVRRCLYASSKLLYKIH